MAGFPQRRMRRMRSSAALRALRRETRLSPEDFISPLFVVEDKSAAGPVASMPGVERFTLASLDREIEALTSCGLRGVLVFGVPSGKDATGIGAAREDSVAAETVRKIKTTTDRLAVFTDVCLCSYTDHGHCGVVRHRAAGLSRRDQPASRQTQGGPNTASPLINDGHVNSPPLAKGGHANSSPLTKGGHRGVGPGDAATIDNDATLEILAGTAIAHARAGADVVAPSGMMDGAIAAMRAALDAAGFADIGILSYAVKYASSFYGPFRDAAESAPAFGDRRSYQMDPANVREALAEAELDLNEGADAIMVKPAMPYLDVIRRVRDAFPSAPLAAYQVSGEYSMIKAAAANGWLNEQAVALEALTAIKRAGADMIITYFAKDAAKWLRE